jgi:hypothetical protein
MDGEVIFKYTRQQAIEDGVLIDLSDMAKEAGLKFPVAVTAGVYSVLNNTEVPAQDFNGRAWDMFTILISAIRNSKGGDTIYFAPLFATKTGGRPKLAPVNLWAKCGPGDDLNPVITVMLEGED